MSRSNPAEDFSQIKKQLQQLDQQIPVPFAATAKGMKDRLSLPAAAKPHLSHKWVWSAAFFLLLAIIGYGLWMPLSPFVATDNTAAGTGGEAQPEAAQKFCDTDEAVPYELAEAPESGAFSQNSAVSSALRGTLDGSTDGLNEKKAAYYPAESYGQIQLALSTIPSSDSSLPALSQNSDSDFLPGADCSVSMVDHTYQYTLTCTPEGASRLDIRSASDGALLSRTDVNCIHGTLFTEGQMLVLAGECAQGTQLQFFDISDPTNPILHRTLVQEGCYLGAWKADGSLLVSSVYQVKDAVDFIPGIYDSSSDQKKLLAADQILLSDTCSSASFAVVTAVSLSSDTGYASFAVLGGSGVTFSSGELTVSTVGNESVFSIQQEQLQQKENGVD